MNKDLLCGLMLLGIAIVVLGFVAWEILSNAYTCSKLRNASKNQIVILEAIYLYRLDHIGGPFDVDYSDMKSVEDTYKRFWDWGYKLILPPDKYEIIKPYIKEAIEMYKKEK